MLDIVKGIGSCERVVSVGGMGMGGRENRKSERQPPSVAVFFNMVHPVFRKVLSGILSYASQRGMWNIYIHEGPITSTNKPLTKYWDGVILSFGDPREADVSRLKIPLVGVALGQDWDDPSTAPPYVAADNAAIARVAAEHLIERGFDHLAYCGFSPKQGNRWSEQRMRAFHEFVAQTGRACATYDAPKPTPTTWGKIRGELKRWLASLPRPLGLMACNDAWARQVLEACHAIGARVPEDVAVVGVDNEEAICLFTDPPLTSVDQGCARAGYEAAALLDRWMAGQKIAGGKHPFEPAGIVTRQSTDILAIADPDVTAALRFIRQHACESIGLEQVAAATGAARSTLRRRFKAVLGRTIHAEIERVRVDRAKHLLMATDWNLRHIAKESGFSSAAYLVAILRRREGLTPTEYRRRYASYTGRTP